MRKTFAREGPGRGGGDSYTRISLSKGRGQNTVGQFCFFEN